MSTVVTTPFPSLLTNRDSRLVGGYLPCPFLISFPHPAEFFKVFRADQSGSKEGPESWVRFSVMKLATLRLHLYKAHQELSKVQSTQYFTVNSITIVKFCDFFSALNIVTISFGHLGRVCSTEKIQKSLGLSQQQFSPSTGTITSLLHTLKDIRGAHTHIHKETEGRQCAHTYIST